MFYSNFIIVKKDLAIKYYNCVVNNTYKVNVYFYPLCTYDPKKRIIHIYGYICNNNSYYKYKRIDIFSYGINKIKYKSLTINILKIKRKIYLLSLCIVTVHKYTNFENVIRTCLMYRKLGVEHITMYISYYNKSYEKQIKWLRRQRYIEIINYQFPNLSFFYFGQDSKLNHCINYYRYVSRYVIVSDIDEVIIPAKDSDLYEILKKYGLQFYVFVFKSVLFAVDSTLSNIFHTSNSGCVISKGYEKMILRPDKINSIGAHFPKEYEEEKRMKYISLNDAYVRHARTIIFKKKFSKCTTFYDSNIYTKLHTTVEKEVKLIEKNRS